MLSRLPAEVAVSDRDIAAATSDGQVRVFWDETPIDLFFDNHPFHEVVAKGVIRVPLEQREIPVLDGCSLIVFKAMFDRTKDWADIESVIEWDSKPAKAAVVELKGLVGADDPVTRRLAALLEDGAPGPG